MKKSFPAILITLLLLVSHTIPAVASMTTTTKGTLYDDAVFELEEKLASWENLEEDIEIRELERMRNVFANLSGSSAQFSKGFRQYIDVLISIAYESYASVEGQLYQIKKNGDFCSYLETVHQQYVHIGTIMQLENYATGRKNQFLAEDAASNKQEELQYYQAAIDGYDRCGGWLDSAQRYLDLIGIVNEYQKDLRFNIQEGRSVLFGRYEQDNRMDDTEPIEWIILDVNTASGAVTLLSRYILDCQQYHHNENVTVAWRDSNIRNWLNNEFYNTAFTDQEKQAIMQKQVSNSLDYVYLLETREIEFRKLDKNGCEATRYAANSRRVYVAKDNGLSPWWVRDDYMSGHNGYFVGAHGKIYNSGNNPVTSRDNGVRPVIVVDLDRFLGFASF